MTPALALLAFLAVFPPLFLIAIASFPGLLVGGPPRRFFYRLHRLRRVLLGIAVVAWLGLVGLWWGGWAAVSWPLGVGTGLAMAFAAYFLGYPLYAFRPVRNPVYRRADEVELPDDLLVIGVSPDSKSPPRAYTLPTLIQAHSAIDMLGDEPRMVTWCTLANTGAVLRLDPALGPLETLRSATAINDNICFHHLGTDNLVQQIESRVVCGPDAGRRLEAEPVLPVSWGVWRKLHPDTQVCDMPPRRLAERLLRRLLLRIHEGLPDRKTPFHRMDRPPDPRLPLMTRVLALELGGEARAWPCSWLFERRVVSTEVGGEPLVLLGDRARGLTAAFSRRPIGSTEVLALNALEPKMLEAPQGLHAARSRDGSVWDLAGRCVAGPRAGAQLAPVPHFSDAFWFAWARVHPETRLPDGVP